MRALSLSLLLSLLPSVATAQDVEERRALLIGSSSVNGAVGLMLHRELRALGVTLDRRSRGASGFARPDFFDWSEEIGRLGPLDRYELVFIYAGGNDPQSLYLRRAERETRDQQWVRWSDEERWRAIYEARVRDVVDALCAAGAPRVVVLPPIDGGRDGWRDRIPRVIAAQRRGVQGSRCGVAIDANDGSSFDSHDGVHLTRAGARRMWTRIELPILDLLDHPPPPATAALRRDVSGDHGCPPGDHACVCRALEGRDNDAAEHELLIEAYRARGMRREALRQMRAYLRLHPATARAGGYRRILERAHHAVP